MNQDKQITVEQLLAKIGELVVKLDIANATISLLKEKIAELESETESSKK